MAGPMMREEVQQKHGAHAAMVAIGAVALLVAVGMAILGWILGSVVDKTGDKTTTQSPPSDALLTSLLAVGAVLIIVGFLWARITSIKVAGAEIGLSDDEKQKVADTLAEKLPEGAKPEEAARTAFNVAADLTEQKAAGTSLTDDDISTVVDQHTKAM